jgi:hypothetical protein
MPGIFSPDISVSLQMEQHSNAHCYAFPLFIPENDLHRRKVPHIFFAREGRLIHNPESIGLSGQEMVQKAFDHLRQRAADWLIEVDADSRTQYLWYQDDNHAPASAKLLDPFFMERACALLHTNELAVMIPNTTMIMAAPLASIRDNDAFTARAKTAFEKIAGTSLSDLTFAYTRNRITDVLELLTENEAVGAGSDKLLPGTDQLLKIVEIPVFTGDFFYKVEIGASDDAQLIDLCEKVIFHLLQKGTRQPRFLGIIEFVIDRGFNPYTPGLDDKLSRFWLSLKEAQRIRQLSTRMKRNIELSIVFGEDFSAGHNQKRKYFKLTYYK